MTCGLIRRPLGLGASSSGRGGILLPDVISI